MLMIFIKKSRKKFKNMSFFYLMTKTLKWLIPIEYDKKQAMNFKQTRTDAKIFRHLL